eukprot:jgi/Ulvmu1/4691/UM002_0422.1
MIAHSAELEETEMIAVCIKPQQAGEVISVTSRLFPLPTSLSHLKRVRKDADGGKLQVIVCTADACTDAACAQIVAMGTQPETPTPPHQADACIGGSDKMDAGRIPQAACEYLSANELLFSAAIVKVPTHPAPTRELWTHWTKMWPITWRPPSDLYRDAARDLTGSDRLRMLQHADSIIEYAEVQGTQNACMMVDPVRNSQVAMAVDMSREHPLKHAVMQLLEAVAQASFTDLGAPGVEPVNTVEGPLASRKRCRTGTTTDGVDMPEYKATAGVAGNVVDVAASPIGEVLLSGSCPADSADNERPYLCTGYDCYVMHEPCVMCAMALTHSRVRRVIYTTSDDNAGALGGSFRLHSRPSLNHHVQVFHVHRPQNVDLP